MRPGDLQITAGQLGKHFLHVHRTMVNHGHIGSGAAEIRPGSRSDVMGLLESLLSAGNLW